jgi:N-acetylmuramoyl-L-alanine amidase
LTAALCRVFPGIRCEAPRDESGSVLNVKLPDDQLRAYAGVLGHYHIQTDKVDPGPAFDWDRYLREARRWLR